MNIKPSFLFKAHFHFIGCLALFFLLLARNPFSDRTQIPNFEPYPDSLHYIVPARSLLAGTGPYLAREGQTLPPSVPILYSFSLLPFFLLYNDPRIAYVANVVLASASFLLFYLILQRIHIQKGVASVVLFLYATNYYLYWYPTLVMAENLTLVVFLFSIFLLVTRVTPKRAGIAACIAIAFYATKYANISLTVAFGLLYLIRIIFPQGKLHVDRKTFIAFIGFGIISFALFAGWETYFYEKNLLSDVRGAFSWIFPKAATTSEPVLPQAQAGNGYFSSSYVPGNLRFYLRMLLGRDTKMLWVFTPLLPLVIANLAMAGLIGGAVSRKYRFFSASLLLFIFVNISFLSTFYSPDARYFLYVIPALLFGLALLMQSLCDVGSSYGKQRLCTGTLILVLGIFLLISAKRIKGQISLNLRHAETPWYSIAVRELNAAVDDVVGSDSFSQKPIVITALPPYFVDFYANGKYTLLPLHPQQEFRGSKERVYGSYDFSDMHALYKTQLSSGKTVLVEKYGLGNEAALQDAFADLSTDFDLRLVRTGCHDLCSVYQLTAKEKKM